MPAIPPSPTRQITVGDVATTLGNATKNMGGFRGFGGVIPATGSISMSACQKIQYGVGYYSSWFRALSSVTQGTWADTSITNNGNMTYSIWVTTNNINDSSYRPLLDVAPTGYFTDGLSIRRPALFIHQNSDKFHVVADCSGNNPNQGINQTTTGIPLNTKTNIIVVYNGSTVTAYVNGTAAGSLTLTGTPTAALTTDEVTSPVVNSTYSSFGNFALNYLWFFPYAMNATQVSTYYTTTNALVPNFSFPASATGGTISTSGSYTIHTFSASGTFTFTMLAARAVSVVVVGGGASGTNGTSITGGSGGAGGGVSIITNASLSSGNSVTVTVGAKGTTSTIAGSMSVSATGGGGAASVGADTQGNDGTTVSVAGTNIVYGGGGGGGASSGSGASGGAGGGGGGGDAAVFMGAIATDGFDGSNGLGGGGGGGGSNAELGSAPGSKGSGGSGVVVFWYLT